MKHLLIISWWMLIQLSNGDHGSIYKLTTCNNNYYPITVNDVNLKEANRKVFVSGSLSTSEILNAPISASLTVKRYVKWAKVWLEVPCTDGIGSCTYHDLCSYGFPQNRTCPDRFVEDKVPCRCPIKEGIYTLQPEKHHLLTLPEQVQLQHKSFNLWTPIAGTYWIEVRITSGNYELSCYQLYFDYSDENGQLEKFDVEPFVNFVR